ncbi:HNH endonuclease [Aedoeadaptatus pacaensis]
MSESNEASPHTFKDKTVPGNCQMLCRDCNIKKTND